MNDRALLIPPTQAFDGSWSSEGGWTHEPTETCPSLTVHGRTHYTGTLWIDILDQWAAWVRSVRGGAPLDTAPERLPDPVAVEQEIPF